MRSTARLLACFCFHLAFPQLMWTQVADTANVDSFSVALQEFSAGMTTIRAASDSSLRACDWRLKELEAALASATNPQRLKICSFLRALK